MENFQMAYERPLWILGTGGHAQVVAAASRRIVAAWIGPDGDMTDAEAEEKIQKRVVDVDMMHGIGFVGTDNLRERLYERYLAAGGSFLGVRHPSALVEGNTDIATDAQLLLGATVAVGATIGRSCVLNTRAMVDHHSRIGDHSHVAPGALVCGGVSVGQRVFIGAGAVVLPGRSVGDGAVIGAGAVVVDDVMANATVAGIPARKLDSRFLRIMGSES